MWRNDLYKTRLADPDSYAAAREAVHPLQVLQQVQEDNIFVTEEQWERINGKAVVNTETVDSVSDTLTNASLKLKWCFGWHDQLQPGGGAFTAMVRGKRGVLTVSFVGDRGIIAKI
ncbi:MAG: hypothetical protein ACLR6I_02890 [Waltera sp.]